MAAFVTICATLLTAYTVPRLFGSDGKPATPAAATSPSPSPEPAQVVEPVPAQSHLQETPVAYQVDRIPMTGPYGTQKGTGSQAVALTFDDGPDPTWTPRILAVLREYRIKATFCVIGVHARDHPDLIRAIVQDGHSLCNHSWDHNLYLGQASWEELQRNLERTNAAIRHAVPDAEINYFRQPGGNWTQRSVSVARAMGMSPLHWSVDPQDWRKPPASAISHTVVNQTHPGAVVLLHDGGGDRSATYQAVQDFLPVLRERFWLVAL